MDELKQAIWAAHERGLDWWKIYYAVWQAEGWVTLAISNLRRPFDHGIWSSPQALFFHAGWDIGGSKRDSELHEAENVITTCWYWTEEKTT
jgi:hypothetical protein